MSPDDFSDAAGGADPAWLAARAGPLAQTFALADGDIALVLDPAGTILGVGQGPAADASGWAANWVGRAWGDTVHADSRAKVRLMLEELAATGQARRREINHLTETGATVPVAYRAIRLGPAGPGLAVGRDLSTVAAAQQRLLAAQAQMEARRWRTG